MAYNRIVVVVVVEKYAIYFMHVISIFNMRKVWAINKLLNVHKEFLCVQNGYFGDFLVAKYDT